MAKIVLVSIVLSLSSIGIADGGHHAKHKSDATKQAKVVDVEIGEKGFQPNKIKVKRGERLVLNITRKTNKTCMKKIKHPTAGQLIDLPLNKKVEVAIGSFQEKKDVNILCGMGMKNGVININ